MNPHPAHAHSAFFSRAHHEVRQRLHVMKLLAHSTRSSLEPQARAHAPLAQLSAVAEELEFCISGVLDFARLDHPALQPHKSRVELQDLFQQLDLHFEDRAAAGNVALGLRTTGLTLLTDAALLMRILDSLVSNAVKFARDRVLVAARRRGDAWAIEVWDNGPGIHPGTEQAIFQAFYQDRQASGPRNTQGLGLGLAIARRLADCLGYRLHMRSVPGKGCVMRVLVPLSDTQP